MPVLRLLTGPPLPFRDWRKFKFYDQVSAKSSENNTVNGSMECYAVVMVRCYTTIWRTESGRGAST